MKNLEVFGQVPKPRNGSKWKLVIGGKAIQVGKEAIPPSVPISTTSISTFLKEAEEFSRKYPDAFEEAEHPARHRHR